MKVKPSVKPICEKCKVIKRKGRVMIICAGNLRTWPPSVLGTVSRVLTPDL